MPGLNNSDGIVTYKVFSGGSEIPGHYTVESISVIKEINKISSAIIKIQDGGVSSSDSFKVSDSKKFDPGKEIEIKAGYDSKEETIFKGIVISYGLRITESKCHLVIECKDKAVKLTVGRKNAIFEKKTDSDVIKQIINDYSLSVDAESTNYQYEDVLQHYVTDWDFVITRAEINGMVVINSDGSLKIKKPATGSSVVDITFGSDLLNFNGYIDARTQLKQVKSYAWDMDNQDLVDYTASTSSNTSAGNLSSSTLANVVGLSKFELQTTSNAAMDVITQWADAKLAKASYAKVRGNLSIKGNSKILPGDTITLKELSDQFNGDVYVGSVEHVIEDGTFTTRLGLGLSPEWYAETKTDIAAPPAAGLIAPMKGLHIGTVQQIDQDPNGQYRVKVSIPVLRTDNLYVWARMANFYATADAGLFFMPETNDEVVIGFLNEDPHHPVILGSLYNKNAAPPFTADSDNYIKALVTKEKLTIKFDDENKAIILVTPDKNTITLNDKDKKITIADDNKNKIEMSEDGILIESSKDFILKAKGDIKITSTGKTSIKADGDVKVEGMNIENKAQTQYTGKGAMVEINGSGQTTVKGGVVMIN